MITWPKQPGLPALKEVTGGVSYMEEVRKFDGTDIRAEMLGCILDGLNLAIYVSDMSTNEVIYASTELRRTRDGSTLAGKPCWEALKDKDKRCGSCPILYLLGNPGKSYQKQFNVGERRYQVYDSIIPWLNGRRAHLHYIVDITE